MEQLQPTPQELDARAAASIREYHGLPVDSTDEQVSAAISARAAASQLGGTALQ